MKLNDKFESDDAITLIMKNIRYTKHSNCILGSAVFYMNTK